MKKIFVLIISAPFALILFLVCMPLKLINDGLNQWAEIADKRLDKKEKEK